MGKAFCLKAALQLPERLQFQQLLAGPLSLRLVHDLLALQATLGLLLQPLSLVAVERGGCGAIDVQGLYFPQ